MGLIDQFVGFSFASRRLAFVLFFCFSAPHQPHQPTHQHTDTRYNLTTVGDFQEKDSVAKAIANGVAGEKDDGTEISAETKKQNSSPNNHWARQGITDEVPRFLLRRSRQPGEWLCSSLKNWTKACFFVAV